jgi:anhydro-N-acetylmuramic acid kinase
LGEEWVKSNIWPLIESFNLSTENTLNTFYHHVVMQIQDVVERESGAKVLITGGGAYNKYLVKLIKKHINKEIVIPTKKIIEYKEALIFAFMGLLRLMEKENSLASVTGSINNNVGGSVFIG